MDDNFLTPMIQAAAQFKELFDSYVQVGFTEEQALTISLNLINTSQELDRKYGNNNG